MWEQQPFRLQVEEFCLGNMWGLATLEELSNLKARSGTFQDFFDGLGILLDNLEQDARTTLRHASILLPVLHRAPAESIAVCEVTLRKS